MAFNPERLSLIVDAIGGGSVRIFGYETVDPRLTVFAADYIPAAASRGLRESDLFLIYDQAGDLYTATLATIDAAGNGTLVPNVDQAGEVNVAEAGWLRKPAASPYFSVQDAFDQLGLATPVGLADGNFGATGTADDSATFQAAIDWIRDNLPDGRGRLYIPPGTYRIQGVNFYPGIYLEGAGAGATILTTPIVFDNSGDIGTAILNAEPGAAGASIFEYGGVRGLSIIGPGTGIESTPGNRSPDDITAGAVYRVNGIDFRRIDYPGPSSYRLYQWMILECRIGQCNIGVNFYKNLYDVTVEDNFIHNNQIGVFVDLQHPNVLNNDFRYNDIGFYGRIVIDWACTQNRISLGRIGVTGDYAGTYTTAGAGVAATHYIPTKSLMFLLATVTGTISPGDTVTGNTSGATATVLVVDDAGVRVTNVVGTFTGDPDGEPDFEGIADATNTGEGETLTFSSGATAQIDYIQAAFLGGIQRSSFTTCTFWQNAYCGLDLGYQNRVTNCLFKGPKGDFPTPVADNIGLLLRQRQNTVSGCSFFGDNALASLAFGGAAAATQATNQVIGNWFYVNYGPAIAKTGAGSCPQYQINDNTFYIYNDLVSQEGSAGEEGVLEGTSLTGRYLVTQTKGAVLHVPAGVGLIQGWTFCNNVIRVDGTAISPGDPDYATGDLVLATPLINILDTGVPSEGPQLRVEDNDIVISGGVTVEGYEFGSLQGSRFTSNDFVATGTGTNVFASKVVTGSTVGARIRDNGGYATEGKWDLTVANGGSSIVQAHGLVATPRLAVRPTNATAAAASWYAVADGTNITITTTAAVGADATFAVDATSPYSG